MIDVDSVSKSYGSVRALDDVSFRVGERETVGLLGPNGAGKTTLMRLLSTYRCPTSGTVSVCGYDTVTDSLRARRHLGYLPESVPLYEDLTPDTYLRYRGRLKELGGGELRERIDAVLDACNLRSMNTRPVSALSKGYRKRLGLADALLAEPDVLLLDEPTEGLDPNQVRETRQLIRSLSERTTLLLSTHILSDVRAVCNRILIISGGTLRFDDAVAPSERSDGTRTIELAVENGTEELEEDVEQISAVEHVERRENAGSARRYVITATSDVRTELFYACAERDCPVREMTLREASLQQVFARHSGKTSEEQVE